MSKGLETKEKILERAYLLASKDGLEGLTIGTLADALAMSKSGLFAHFGSKEELQVAVLQHAAQLFEQEVVVPAFKAPRGEPRVKKLLENWLEWASGSSAPGGCIFVAAP
jgi:AcrR family transcriptional regulator